MKSKVALCWLRRDLRLDDNAALTHALASGVPVLPVFIFDTGILATLPDQHDRRVDYIHQALQQLHNALQSIGSGIATDHATPLEAFARLAERYDIQAVYWNRDYEPQAKARDRQVADWLRERHIPAHTYKDQVIFDQDDILKADGTPYTVYTPYARKWMATLQDRHHAAFNPDWNNFYPHEAAAFPSLAEIGFKKTDLLFAGTALDASLIQHYGEYRDYMALDKTSKLGIALRFGTISIRQCVTFALAHSATWLSELIWREFFMQMLDHFPHVATEPFKPRYAAVPWRNDEQEFARWCAGATGYPIVDAGMRQLNETGFMHNRARMIVASFLCKHLLIDWRWGEVYFAQKLNDYDLAANNGNWQWASGSGCDAAPYFRIFNPKLQAAKFDPDGAYVRRWIPKWDTNQYPDPIVDHALARERALKAYSEALN